MVKNVSAKVDFVGGQKRLPGDRWEGSDQESLADEVIFQLSLEGYTLPRADTCLNSSQRGSHLLGL